MNDKSNQRIDNPNYIKPTNPDLKKNLAIKRCIEGYLKNKLMSSIAPFVYDHLKR
jgi:hypothetical protein